MNSKPNLDVETLHGIPRDTTPDAYWRNCDALRRLGTAGRLQLAFELTEEMWKTVEAGIRRRHPEYSDEQVRMAIFRMRLGDELFRIGYPDQG